MSPVLLYLRSRQGGAFAGSLLGLGLCGAGLAEVTGREAAAPVLPVLLSASAAALTGVSLRSPFGRTEAPFRTGPLGRARLAHVLCAYVAALVALAPAAWAAGGGPAVAATGRGLVGYDAAALLAVSFLGAARSWVPVLCLAVAALSLPLPSATCPWLWGWTGTDVRGPTAWLSAAAVVLLARLASGVADGGGLLGVRARGARRVAG